MLESFAHSIFCEDIRHEVGEKISFMGVYPANAVTFNSTLPITIPKLVVANWLGVPKDKPAKKISIIVSGPPLGSEHIELEFVPNKKTQDQSEDSNRRIYFVLVAVGPLELVGSGFLSVLINADGTEVHGGRLRVDVNDPTGKGQVKL